MKRILLISVIFAAMLLSGCGTATTSEPAPAPSPAPTPTPAPAPSKNIDPRQLKEFEEAGKLEEEKLDTYYTQYNALAGRLEAVTLRTLKTWQGRDSQIIEFTVSNSPTIVNGVAVRTSKVSSVFSLSYQGGLAGPKLGSKYWTTQSNWHHENKQGQILEILVLEGTGKYKIKVEASGVDWSLKAGAEN